MKILTFKKKVDSLIKYDIKQKMYSLYNIVNILFAYFGFALGFFNITSTEKK